MYHTNEKMKELYESIAVIAIYIPNVVEIPFEENCERLLELYGEYLQLCSKIMQREKSYRDIIIHNTFICGIFDSRHREALQSIVAAARQICDIFQDKNHGKEENLEQLYFGIGVAKGGAVRFPFRNPDINMAKNVWLGKALEDARSLAQTAFRDGREKVRIADMSGDIR